ncbi:hypothetical protein [Micromonospora sp. NPDC092111]|uniref:hypothetical protein n=1 Tax=Micromonospora sp. NPDC092111 TaxID=3364289 RepID=UPI00380E4815
MPIAYIAPVEQQAVANHTGHSEQGRRRPDGNPPLAGPSLPAQRPALLATLLDFHERRANTTGSVDEEIRLLRAHVWALLALVSPLLILALAFVFVFAFKASGLEATFARPLVALAATSVIGTTAYLLRAWIAGRRSRR